MLGLCWVYARTAGRERAGCLSQGGGLNFFDGFLYFISVFGILSLLPGFTYRNN